MSHRIIPRSEWGARYQGGWADSARTLPIRTSGASRGVWLHHTVMARPPDNASFATDAAQVRAIEAVGQGRFGGGISYTAVVTPSGRIFEGHPMHRKGAHTVGHNRHGAAIVLAGDYSTKGPTQKQLDSVAWLLREWHRLGWVDHPRLTGGHRDAPGNSTACPGGAAHRQIGEINRRAAAPPKPAPPAVPDWQTPEHMTAVQTGLNTVTSAGLVVDGVRGPKTESATLHYQTEYRTDLDRDGSPGPATLTALGEDMTTLDEINTKVDRLPADVWGRLMNQPGGTGATTRADTFLRYTARRGEQAEALAQLAGLSEAVKLLAQSQGADPDQIEAAARRGAERALDGYTLSLNAPQED